MSTKLDTLSDVEIAKIGQLVEILDKSSFDHLTLELANFKLTLGTGAVNPDLDAAPRAPIASAPVPAATTVAAPAAAPASAPPARTRAAEGLIEVTAPTMGRFYSRPEPSAAPFATLGSAVDADSTVGLVEVMKLFNSVSAGVAGTVEEICVVDAELVEYGQVLMRIRPAA